MHESQEEDGTWEAELALTSSSYELQEIPEIHSLVWDRPVEETQFDNNNESTHRSHSHISHNGDNERKAEQAAATPTTGCNSNMSTEQLYLGSGPRQLDTEWTLPAWCISHESPSPPNNKTLARPIFPNGVAAIGHFDKTDESKFDNSRAPNSGESNNIDTEPCAHSSFTSASSSNFEGVTSEHLELMKLLLDKEWNDFMEMWSARNGHLGQVDRQRGKTWSEHRRLRPVEMREVEELERSRNISTHAMYNVLSASSSEQEIPPPGHLTSTAPGSSASVRPWPVNKKVN